MKKPLQPHLLKRVPPACKGERTMRWRGRPPIGGQENDRVSNRCSAPYTLLPLRGTSPQGETRNLRRKTESHILHVPLRHSPFGGWRHHLSPTSWGHYKAPLCCELLMKGLLFRALLSHRSAGGRWCRKAPKGGEKSHRRWLIDVMLYMTYDAYRLIRNADFISIARKGNPQPSGPKAPSNLRTLGPKAHPS